MVHVQAPLSVSTARRAAAWLALGGVLLAAALTSPARAQGALVPAAPVAGTGELAGLEQIARDWLEPALSAGGLENAQLRPEVIVGQLDSRLRLTACQRIEPYLPPGTRLWGRSRIGLRCLEGPVRWNVFLPVTVKAWGPAWVLKRPVPAGTALVQDDAELAEIDWAEHPASVLADPGLWQGQQAAFALSAGQTLRQNMVRPIPAFAPGTQVRVSTRAGALEVVVTGQALGVGVTGQLVRVRLAGGKVISGTVRDSQTVEVQL